MTMRLVLTALVMACVLAACGEEGSDVVADDPGDTAAPGGRPSAVPAADGEVTGFGMVMDKDRPELCLGPVAESWPPQCGGPPIEGWDWAAVEGSFEQVGQVRWGSFAVTGTFDGRTFTVTEPPVPGALYDVEADPTPRIHDLAPLTEQELQRIADDVGRLPGAQGAYAGTDGQVVVDVLHDDGSLQAWCDAEYGAGRVRVVSALTPAR